MKFVALDVKAANRSRRSICQIAVVVFSEGQEVASDVVLVNPHETFDPINVGIHGIGPDHVQHAMPLGAVDRHVADDEEGFYRRSPLTFPYHPTMTSAP